MFFIYTPQDPSPVYYDPEEAFLEYKRRAYVKQLQEQQRLVQFERELELEKERHQAALAAIARNETIRRQRMAQLEGQSRAQAPGRYEPRQQQYPSYQLQNARYGQQQGQPQPTPREILARRLARQKEEELRSRQFHQNILSHIFGVPVEEFDESMEEDHEEERESPATESNATQPTLAQLVNEFSKRQHLPEQAPPVRKPSLMQPSEPTSNSVATEVAEPVPVPASTEETEVDEPLPELEPHWSTAPERARSLAEITSINRAFISLKNTFVFPSGPLERLASSDAPRLTYNPTNAPIHAYEHALSDLLTKLDSVESYGFKGVREARKQLVVKIEEEILDLDRKIAERLTSGAAPAATPAEVLAPKDVEIKGETTETQVGARETLSETVALPSEPVEAITIPTPTIQPAEFNINESKEVSNTATSDALPVNPTATATSVVEPISDAGIVDAPKTAAYNNMAEDNNTAPSTTTPALPVALPETASDEELEIEDAIQIDATDDESEAPNTQRNEHKSAVGEFEML